MLKISHVKEKVKRFYQFISRRKYLLSVIAFLVWICFLDGDKLIDRWALVNEISDLQDQKANLQSKIKADRQRLKELNTNRSNLEAVAREKYYMHKSNETVFVVEEADSQME